MSIRKATLSALIFSLMGCIFLEPHPPKGPVPLPEGFPETIEFVTKRRDNAQMDEVWVFLVPDDTTKRQLARLMESFAAEEPIIQQIGFQYFIYVQYVYLLRSSHKEHWHALVDAKTGADYTASREALAATYVTDVEGTTRWHLGYIGYPTFPGRELVVQVNTPDIFALH